MVTTTKWFLLGFFLGGLLGFFTAALFAWRSYQTGYEDGRADSGR